MRLTLALTCALLAVSPVLAQELIYSFPLDVDPGWTTEGAWAFGSPSGQGGEHGGPDPIKGNTGAYVYGYNLNGDYPNYMGSTMWLTTNALDLTGYSGVTLSFYRWLGVEARCYDEATLQVSVDGTTWYNVWTNPDI
jgi:hypothetical protein